MRRFLHFPPHPQPPLVSLVLPISLSPISLPPSLLFAFLRSKRLSCKGLVPTLTRAASASATGERNLALLCRAAFEFANTSSPHLAGLATATTTAPPLREGAEAAGDYGDSGQAAKLALADEQISGAGQAVGSLGKVLGSSGVMHLPSVATWYQLPTWAGGSGGAHGMARGASAPDSQTAASQNADDDALNAERIGVESESECAMR